MPNNLTENTETTPQYTETGKATGEDCTFSQSQYSAMADKVDKAADILDRTTERYPNHSIAMLHSEVIQQHPIGSDTCRTIGCIGGFYALGKTTNPSFTLSLTPNKRVLCDTGANHI